MVYNALPPSYIDAGLTPQLVSLAIIAQALSSNSSGGSYQTVTNATRSLLAGLARDAPAQFVRVSGHSNTLCPSLALLTCHCELEHISSRNFAVDQREVRKFESSANVDNPGAHVQVNAGA